MRSADIGVGGCPWLLAAQFPTQGSARNRHTIAMRFKFLLFATLLLTAGVAQSADPQPYVVHFTPTSNPGMNATLRTSSQLESLRTNAPVGPFALIDRAEKD